MFMQINDEVKVISHTAMFCGNPLYDKVGTIVNIFEGDLFPVVVEIDGNNLIFKENEVEKVIGNYACRTCNHMISGNVTYSH